MDNNNNNNFVNDYLGYQEVQAEVEADLGILKSQLNNKKSFLKTILIGLALGSTALITFFSVRNSSNSKKKKVEINL